MICRSCGCIYFEKNKQEVCLSCYTGGNRKPKMVYAVKVWKKFSWGTQQKLTEQYAIILKYPKPMKEKMKEKLKGTFKRNDPVKRKERRDKLFKKLKKIGKGVTSKSGNKKLKNFSMALSNPSSSNIKRELISNSTHPLKRRKPLYVVKTKEDDKFEGLLGRKTDYSALTKRGVPKL